MKVYQKLASKLAAINNCKEFGNDEWRDIHQGDVDLIMTMFPSGSGFDSGTEFDQFTSNPEKLVFTTAYHHMNENGFYTCWTQHTVTITPSLQFDFNIKVSGKNANGIKDYIADCFYEILNREIKH